MDSVFCMKGKSDFLLVRCIDPRLNAVWVQFLRALQLLPESTNYDPVIVAGGAGNLTQVIEHLKIASAQHGIRQVCLTVHEDCATGAKESDLRKAWSAVRQAGGADLTVRAFYFFRDNSTPVGWKGREVTIVEGKKTGRSA